LLMQYDAHSPSLHLREAAHLDHDAHWPSPTIARRKDGDHPLRSASIGRVHQPLVRAWPFLSPRMEDANSFPQCFPAEMLVLVDYVDTIV
jgi:hypothetical protein